jgi:hypothetical protein
MYVKRPESTLLSKFSSSAPVDQIYSCNKRYKLNLNEKCPGFIDFKVNIPLNPLIYLLLVLIVTKQENWSISVRIGSESAELGRKQVHHR